MNGGRGEGGGEGGNETLIAQSPFVSQHMGYFIHAEGINHLYSSSAGGGWERSPALSPGHTVCPGGLQAAATSPSAPAPLPGRGETLNYSLENCSASPRITPCMVLSPQKSNQTPKVEAKKGVSLSLFFGQAVK